MDKAKTAQDKLELVNKIYGVEDQNRLAIPLKESPSVSSKKPGLFGLLFG